MVPHYQSRNPVDIFRHCGFYQSESAPVKSENDGCVFMAVDSRYFSACLSPCFDPKISHQFMHPEIAQNRSKSLAERPQEVRLCG